ncbi:hypothetical protein [Pseudophaeobacter sp. 1A09344]|uniref:hypothetical protein n=1 Tax=Pseudophaeobacter sp. 1A09344 TaxID=3098144 RepID=UPI0034D543C3
MTRTPLISAGDVQASTAMDTDDHLLASVGGVLRRVDVDEIAEWLAAGGYLPLSAVIYSFPTRADFLTWKAAGGTAPAGSIATDGTVFYIATTGATAISDLLGWLPFGVARPEAFPTRLEYDAWVSSQSFEAYPGRIRERCQKFSISAYNPAITRVAVDTGSGLYRHVPSIAVVNSGDLLGAYLFNDSSASESAAGQRAGFIRSTDNGDTWSAKAEELNTSATAENPLDPSGDGAIQGEVFVIYDQSQDEEIAVVAHRGTATRNFTYIATRDASSAASKWNIKRVQWESSNGDLNLSSTVTGAAEAGFTRQNGIDGVAYDAVGFKPFFDQAGDLVVPVVYVTVFGSNHRIGFLRRSGGVWSELGVIPNGVIGVGDAWEPTTWQASDGTYYCQVRNNAGVGGTVADNFGIASSSDLISWSSFAFQTSDTHVNRKIFTRAKADLWLGVGVSHSNNRNSLDLFSSGDGHSFVFGATIGNETDSTDFVHYSDIDVSGETAYVLYSEENDQASSAAPNEIRFARFALPDGLPMSGSRKNEYELGSGTPPSASGTELTIPPQMIGSVATFSRPFVLSIRARVSAAPTTNKYTIVSVGDAVNGYFAIEYRDNGGTTELWAGGVYIQDVGAPTSYSDFNVAIDPVRRVVSAFGQSGTIARRARVYLGDTDPAGAQTGNIVYDASASSMSVYDRLPHQYAPDFLPQKIGDTEIKGQLSVVPESGNADSIVDAPSGAQAVFRQRINGSTRSVDFFDDTSGEWYRQVEGTNILSSSGTSVNALVDLTAEKKVSLGAKTEITISSGSVTISKSYHSIDTEADAATDDLDTINGGSAGDILVLQTAASARDVTVKHATGNIFCGSDRVLNNVADRIVLHFDGLNWHMISYADN